MAAVKKYQGLPDLDLGTEIYETAVPELTEASTLPTESDTISDDGNQNPNFVRQQLDPDAARQRFEPYNVDARDVNFSDTIDGGRRDYQIRSRRRRRRAALAREQQGEYSSDESEEETIQGRLARLRKEAAELQAEIEEIDRKPENDVDGDSDYEDTIDHQTDDVDNLHKGIDEVRGTLESAAALHRKKKGMTLEEEFTRKLQTETSQSRLKQPTTQDDTLPQTSLSAIADFSDRLSLLETALGVSLPSKTQPNPASILPTLTTLTTQIETLYTTLSPRPDGVVDGANGPITQTTTVHLDPMAEKIRLLISESKRLEDSRKAATKSFEELLETRDRHAHLFHHSHPAVHSDSEPRLSRNHSGHNVNGDHDSRDRGQPKAITQDQFTPLFLDSHANKISALYNVLPTIQSLQPLLPVVLERLRALSVIHVGAADVKTDIDEFESELSAQEKEIKTWQEALESAEKAMQENKEIMKENVEVVGGKVRGLEERVKKLGR
ncbi:hypothetical protein H2198_001778 [Neophaeococcomyces mojaviensis]|uniref:Uncharacterized protein n=1 Tax=Neophaeococcomyces mojaviensis TaxID=3383035 RepID=A0ACC3AG56_9EURO|nr:hypothetical protein H2198_001778 [Knufia sp. JES_112]